MANRFLGQQPWRSYRERRTGTGSWPREGNLMTRNINSDVRVAIRHNNDPHEPEADNTNPPINPADPVPARIMFTRRLYNGNQVVGTIAYVGWMTSERQEPNKSTISGTYTITPIGISPFTDPETGDWTANRPPPTPGPRPSGKPGGSKKASSKKAMTGGKGAASKKSSAKKAAKSQKPPSKRGTSAKPTRSGKATKKAR